MPDLTPAAELRAAAALLRSHAEAASADAGTPWVSCTHQSERESSSAYLVSTPRKMLLHGGAARGRYGPFVTGPVGRWIALMDPDFGPLIASWLEDAARDAEMVGPNPRALRLARKINTPTEET